MPRSNCKRFGATTGCRRTEDLRANRFPSIANSVFILSPFLAGGCVVNEIRNKVSSTNEDATAFRYRVLTLPHAPNEIVQFQPRTITPRLAHCPVRAVPGRRVEHNLLPLYHLRR